MEYLVKRVYDDPEPSDGFRVLVDRLWPRGLTKEHAALDVWLKDVAPSPQLRMWFAHSADRFDVFSERYRAELAKNPAVDELRREAAHKPTVTLLYGAKDTAVNHAVVLAAYMRDT
jgi:uncharacterized protein YeaO (DUF488 family)